MTYLLVQQQEEEEKLTPYTPNELNQEWEFKIVRVPLFNHFENPEVFTRLLDEEAQVGWIFLEKLDATRVRFKRPRSAAAGDVHWLKKGLNPYRTVYSYGSPIQFKDLKGLFFILAFLILLGLFLSFMLILLIRIS